MTVTTRFCPSPTGRMHFANIRTAILNFYYARSVNGKFLLRIEDTDQSRSKDEYVEQILEDLSWLGIDSDLDLIKQSQRFELYNKYIKQLLDSGDAYYCFCSQEQLAMARKANLAQGLAPKYSGTCRHLTTEEVNKKKSSIKPTIRFKIPEYDLKVNDLLKGDFHYKYSELGDFVIAREDGSCSFMFVNALDDSLQGVTHVYRGEDHLTNTPRQNMILKQLDLRIPLYGHFPMILGKDHSKLSKRNGSLSIQQLKELGFLPNSIINYALDLGTSFEANITNSGSNYKLDLTKFSNSQPIFDIAKIEQYNTQLLRNMPVAELKKYCDDEEVLRIIQPNIETISDLKQLSKLFYADLNLTEQAKTELASYHDSFADTVYALLADQKPIYDILIKELSEKLSIKGKKLFMPLRLILTSSSSGPNLKDLYNYLSQNEILNRVKQCL